MAKGWEVNSSTPMRWIFSGCRAAAGPRATRFGTLLIRVQPSGADILIDGELWEGPEGSERLAVQVPEGRRVVEIRRTGYRGFSTEVEVRGGESVPLNVSLTPE